MKYLFLEYPKCTTCQKARRWLEENHIEFSARHIVENNPSAEEIATWQNKGQLPLKKFINTSGLLYKSMDLKNKFPNLSEEEQRNILASNGMLVKRPILVGEDFVLTGFKEQEWLQRLKKNKQFTQN